MIPGKLSLNQLSQIKTGIAETVSVVERNTMLNVNASNAVITLEMTNMEANGSGMVSSKDTWEALKTPIDHSCMNCIYKRTRNDLVSRLGEIACCLGEETFNTCKDTVVYCDTDSLEESSWSWNQNA